jgi:predicted dinucleotide-binding enzyme
MKIAILGSGLMGGKLGILFSRAGHDVVFSYARSERKLKRLAREAGGNARAGTPAHAARDADAVLLAVHWSRIADALKQAGDLADKVMISDVGFEPVDAGPLRIARYLEPFTLLMGQLAYEGGGGPEIAYRFDRFA